mgnify:CR=1 FL=1
MIPRTLIALCLAFTALQVSADDIAGIWKHADEPGWIEITLEDGRGTGTVLRNDKFPERVGRKILKGLQPAGEGEWHGQVYAERMGEYRDVKVLLAAPDSMHFKVKVGFITRTLEWVRSDAASAAAGPDNADP